MKLWKLSDAEAVIPELEKIFEEIAELAAKARLKTARLESLEGKPAEAAIERSQLQFLANEMTERLQGIADMGAVPKGLEPALVDFPSKVHGQDAFLCWRLGEKRITHYHGFDEGFSSRKKLPRSDAE